MTTNFNTSTPRIDIVFTVCYSHETGVQISDGQCLFSYVFKTPSVGLNENMSHTASCTQVVSCEWASTIFLPD